jgi:multidrug efflux system membrane fusion protein
MRRFFSYGLALIIVIALGLWLATGVLVTPGNGPGKGETTVVGALQGKEILPKSETEGPDPSLSIAEREAETTGAQAAPRSVRIATYRMTPMPVEVPLRGRTKAKAQVSVMAETQGTVQEVLVKKGQKVKEGDVLCKLEPETRQAAVTQAEAAVATAQSAVEANAALRKKGLAPANSGLQLEAQLKQAQAGLANAKAELARVDVKATISGVVQDPLATVGSTLGPTVPCATIVQLDPMLFVASVPEARIGYARVGLPATITTITGQTLDGKVSFISSTADPDTRSFPIEIQIPNADGNVRDGITAEAIVDVGTAPAHLLPQSVLTLDDDGILGVRAVENSKVVFYPVTILKDTREGTWVAGLPPVTNVITVGQEYVEPGQVVDAAYGPADEPGASPATEPAGETAKGSAAGGDQPAAAPAQAAETK